MPLQLSGAPSTSALVGSALRLPAVDQRDAWYGTDLLGSEPADLDQLRLDSPAQLSGTPAQAGTFSNIVISATDGIQTATLAAFSITVTAPTSSSPPTIFGTPATWVTAGSLYTFTPQASDPAGKPLTFSIQNQPAWASFSTCTGALTGTPTSAQAGTYAGIVISVSDGTQSASLAPFSIKVVAPLKISGSPATQVSSRAELLVPSHDERARGQPAYFLDPEPPDLGDLQWCHRDAVRDARAPAQAGTYSNIVISVSDGSQSVALPAFAIQVTAPLKISGNPPTQVTAGKPYTFQPTTTGPAGTTLVFSIQNKPAWGTFSTSTGVLTGTPSASQVGTYANIVISVSAASQTSALQAFSIAVASAAPTISGVPPASVNVGSAYNFVPDDI